MKRLGLVITTFNRPEYTKEYFDSIMKYPPPDDSLIVIVDDASTNKETLKLIKEFSVADCEIIRILNKKNRSIKYTLRIGIDKCFERNCHYVTNIDGDAIINHLFYDRLTYLYEINHGHIVTGFNCLTKNNDGTERHHVIKDFSVYNLKKSVGGVNMFFTINEYDKYIKPALDYCLANKGNWDNTACTYALSDNKCIICSSPSVVQHIGFNSSMGHSTYEQPDVADDFQYLHLPNVTLVIADCVDINRVFDVVDKSCRNIIFGDIKILTSIDSIDSRVIKIKQLRSKIEYSEFMINNLSDYFDTEFCLVIQYDGYVLNAAAWRPEWLNFDYIGATWNWYKNRKVGNGGFSLRSKKLQDILRDDKSIVLKNQGCDSKQEDHNICRVYGEYLENKYNIKFATENEANLFSIEAYKNPNKSYNNQFGFHGKDLIFNKTIKP